VKNKSIVDFLGSYKEQFIAFVVKECLSSDGDSLKDHQHKTGGISFLFVRFKGQVLRSHLESLEYGLD
jgi:penicillin-binding protein-related factor A (putative recombinase)